MASDGCQVPAWKTGGAFPHLYHHPREQTSESMWRHVTIVFVRSLPLTPLLKLS